MEICISVITPCYNGEPFVRDAIRSVLDQKNPAVEMILVDDGSLDGTENACRELECPNLRYIHIENHGAGFARNVGLEQARGRWIAFLDSDDLLLKDCFRPEMTDWLAGQEADILRFPKLKTDFCLKNPPQATYPEAEDEILHHIPRLEFCTCLFRAEFLRENGIRFFTYRRQDVESAFRYQTFSRARKLRTFRSSYFFLQRDNPASNTHTWNRYALYEIKADIYRELAQTTPCPEDLPFLLRTASDCVFYYYRLCLGHGHNGKEHLARVHEILTELKGVAARERISLKGDKRCLAAGLLDACRGLLPECRKAETKKPVPALPVPTNLADSLESISRAYPMAPWKEAGEKSE